MHCESCNQHISSKMKGAIKSNTCPFCGEQIMNPLKAEQFVNLTELLDATDFTNKKEVDVQIRTKVATLLLENFVFKKLENTSKGSDLISIDDTTHIVASDSSTSTSFAQPTEQSMPTNTKHSSFKEKSFQPEILEKKDNTPTSETQPHTTSTPRSLKNNKNKNKQKTKLPSLYQTLEESSSLDDENYNDYNEAEGLTPEELKKFFPSLSEQDLSEMLDRSAESKKTTEGTGIRRLNK